MVSATLPPEFIAGVCSSAIVQSAGLALGNILESCAFNLGMLAVMVALIPKNEPLLSSAAIGDILPTAFGLILMAFAGMVMPDEIILLPAIGLFSIIFIIVYLLSVKVIYQFNKLSAIPNTGTQLQLPH
jgi:cation:H+ antiporter